MNKISFGILGFGSRGQMFARLIKNCEGTELAAVAEPTKANREHAHEALGVPRHMCFSDADSFFAAGKICDALFICTPDAQHCGMAVKAMGLGYDICLEKPVGVTIGECLLIRDTANKLGRKVMVCHELRYSPFFQYIKKTVASGAIGDIATINQTENIAYWHFALSYVRGPWRRMSSSSPTIIAKCCHDLDIIYWLMNKKCVRVSSFGSLFYFNPSRAPQGSAWHCADCGEEVKRACLYNAYAIYPERVKHAVVGGVGRLKGQDIFRLLDEKEDPISRCVYRSDNDAIDNQIVNMEFEDGSAAHLTMTAFSQDCHRTIHVHGTKGEIYGDLEDLILHVNIYGKPKQVVDVTKIEDGVNLRGGHGGGDYYLFKDFIDYLRSGEPSMTRTTIDDSIASHIIGFKAEESRKNGGKVMLIEG